MREPSTLPANLYLETAPADRLARFTPGHVLGNAATDPDSKRRMLLLAVLPAALVTVVATVLVSLLAVGSSDGDLDATTGLALLAGALITCAVLGGAGCFAVAQARVNTGRIAQLSAALIHARAELADTIEELKHRAGLPEPLANVLGPLADAAGPYSAARGMSPARDGGVGHREEQVEVFINLARRLQSLVHREIGQLDDLENQVEDPDLLKGLFQVDHLATRVRRYTENLAVLGGAVSHRQWTRPVRVSDVLRSAVAEIEQYSRVKLVPLVTGTVRGHAVADVVHLLAELVENATVFSSPQTRVLLRTEQVSAGLAIEVEDRGLGMSSVERKQMNALLAAPDRVMPGELLRDGRIGLYVVSVLARRHHITVQLQGNIYGGTQAVLILPHEVLGERPDNTDTGRQPATPQSRAAARLVRTREPAAGEYRHAPAATPPDAQDAASLAEHSRPRLPQRRRQEHLAPEPRRTAAGSAPLEDVEHNPDLMAAFQAGMRQAEEDDDPGTPSGPPGPV